MSEVPLYSGTFIFNFIGNLHFQFHNFNEIEMVSLQVEDSAAWQSRARRMQAQGRDVNARAVPFSHTRDVRKLSAEVAAKVMKGNRLIFRIDGASSRWVLQKCEAVPRRARI